MKKCFSYQMKTGLYLLQSCILWTFQLVLQVHNNECGWLLGYCQVRVVAVVLLVLLHINNKLTNGQSCVSIHTVLKQQIRQKSLE